MHKFLITGLSAVLLTGCGGSGGEAEVPAPLALECRADASVSSPLGRLHNNTWNSGAVGSQAWRQCVVQRTVAGVTEYGFQWQWPGVSPEVLAYPSLVIGAKPWEPGPGNDARFPRPIAATGQLVLDFDIETTATAPYNLAASVWLIRTPTVADPPDETAISGELMVWTQAVGPDWTAGQVPLATVTVGGASWLLWSRPNWGDVSGSTSHRWPLVVYTAVNPGSQARLDLKAFLADAVGRGLLNGGHHIADVELGHEIAGGSGTSWLRRVSLTVVPVP